MKSARREIIIIKKNPLNLKFSQQWTRCEHNWMFFTDDGFSKAIIDQLKWN